MVVVDLRPSCYTVVRELAEISRRTSGNGSRHSAMICDVTNSSQLLAMIRSVKQAYGKIDIYCSNAGMMYPPPKAGEHDNDDSVFRQSDSQWDKLYRIHVQSHVVAARELVPEWEQRAAVTQSGENDGIGNKGIFIVTASAAGLLTQIGDAGYGVTKAAAVSFAEHLAITHETVQVHCVCPQAVDTPFLRDVKQEGSTNLSAAVDGMLSPEFVADQTLAAIRRGEFWVFPHPRVAEYTRRKANDHRRWIRGMQKLRRALRRQQNVNDDGHLSRGTVKPRSKL